LGIGLAERLALKKIKNPQPMHPVQQRCGCGTFLGATTVRCPTCQKPTTYGVRERSRLKVERENKAMQRRMAEAITGNVR
jgi:hypothetical protein